MEKQRAKLAETASERGTKWTGESEAELAERLERGETTSQIAQLMGRSYEGIK